MDRIGTYELREELGRGGMGVVYRAWDTAMHREVAIKLILLEGVGSSQDRDSLKGRMLKEGRAAGGLLHPNIVTVHHLLEHEGNLCLVMEFVHGKNLETLLRQSTLCATDALRILEQAASALDYAHARGVVHRDVKPANFILSEDNVLKLADFGIARRSSTHTNSTHSIAGTPSYMSPEQIIGKPVDGRGDQFALAVVACRLLTGEWPFKGETDIQVLYHITSSPPSIPAANPRLASPLLRSLAKTPEQRYESCTELVSALRSAMEPETRPAEAPPRPLRLRWIAAVMAAGAMPAAWYWSSRSTSSLPGGRTVAAIPKAIVERKQPEQVPTNTAPSPKPEAKNKKQSRTFQPLPTRVVERSTAAEPDPPQLQHGPSATAQAPIPGFTQFALPAPTPVSPPPVSKSTEARRISGYLEWRGPLPPRATLTIDGPVASAGVLSGTLMPGVPIRITEIRPATVTVVEAPSQSNGWRKLKLQSLETVVPALRIRWESPP
ncbi:MAG: protein kinase [Bryobacterales bacterium]|nr:protein kinase [Bryobacterales bacterium]